MRFEALDTSKPVTNKQLAEAQNKLHDCLHSVVERLDSLAHTVREDRHSATNARMVLGERMARVEGALGVKMPSPEAAEAGERPKPIKRKLAGLSLWQAGGAAMGIATGAAALYRYIFPALEAGFAALHAALMAG